MALSRDWSPRRAPSQSNSLRGFKVALLYIGTRDHKLSFQGLNHASKPYGITAQAQCSPWRRSGLHGRHQHCGFHAYAERADIPYEYVRLAALLLEVRGTGRFIEYEKIYRYEKQQVVAVTCLPCALCSRASTVWSAASWNRPHPGSIGLIGSCGRHASLRADVNVDITQLAAIMSEHDVRLFSAELTVKQIWQGAET